MKKSFLIFCLTVLVAVASAAPRTKAEIEQIASLYMPASSVKKYMPSGKLLHNRPLVTAEKISDAFYVVSNDDSFVIVSADDRMPQVLGYSHSSGFAEDMPEHIRYFLSTYEKAYKQMLESGDDTFFPRYVLDGEIQVGHLLGNIKYDQGAPFNWQCPGIGNNRCLTGCVATAIAQLMRYYRYPAVGTGTFTFTPGATGQQVTVDLQKMPFEWDEMLDDYSGDYTQKQGDAVARLMAAVGAAVGVNYGFDGTSGETEKAQKAYATNFGYTGSEYITYRGSDQPYDDWMRTIVEEFNAGHPVYFAGAPGGDGHAFLLDGYKTTIAGISQDYPMNMLVEEDVVFHVNWGWSGRLDGWFYLGHLQPEDDNYSGYRWEMIFKTAPQGWTSVENVRPATRLGNGAIYNILGMEVDAGSLQPGYIYIQNGRKFIYR